ncbi:hypothetical protein NGB36_05115 [Streptomyces sp. RB6PN25]|uniref:Uncharacterized protein n=1 Tax=Streptomyces humicola TaxID=2953240 RepID=A0ABT1PQP0_9ACTN|nr:hypothetical protein [Streptomyces humicola]MCQ4079986.1 hypothetical protein [Streptomyces humicola]
MTDDEDEINNAALVAQRLLGCDLLLAVDVVREVIAMRTWQFEKAAAALPLFEEFDLTGTARERLLAYVEELQDSLAETSPGHSRPSAMPARERSAAGAQFPEWRPAVRARHLGRADGRARGARPITPVAPTVGPPRVPPLCPGITGAKEVEAYAPWDPS